MLFHQIIGQDQVKSRLIQSIHHSRISHTQLFLGPEGSGALPLAVAYAQMINCLNPAETDSCGVCSSCVKFEKLIHPDLHFTFPTIAIDKKKVSNDFIENWRKAFIENPYISELQWLLTLDDEGKKQGNITAEECRDVIRKVGLKSYEAKYKTIIIWMPEYMRQEGNILLKLLEEPPEKTLILLVGQDAEKVLATILSRAQTIRIPHLSDDAIAQHLIYSFQADKQEAETIARVAEGNLVMARSLMDAGRSDYNELFAEWMRACYMGKIPEINRLIDKISGTGREFIKSFIAYGLHMLRAVLLSRHADDGLIRLSSAEREFIRKFTIVFDDHNIEEISGMLNQTAFHIERNADLKITFLNLSLYISRRLIRQKAASN